MTAARTPACIVCHTTEPPLTLYQGGQCCPAHTPAARAGKPEPGLGRYCPRRRCYCGDCPWWTPRPTDMAVTFTVIDLQAIASGKRRSSPHVYAGAKATPERTTT